MGSSLFLGSPGGHRQDTASCQPAHLRCLLLLFTPATRHSYQVFIISFLVRGIFFFLLGYFPSILCCMPYICQLEILKISVMIILTDTQPGMLINVLDLQTGAPAWSRMSFRGSQLPSLVLLPVKQDDFHPAKYTLLDLDS